MIATPRPADSAELRALWLQMARDGGWWSLRSLRAHWSPTWVEWELQQLLLNLMHLRCVTRREIVPGVMSYAVTSDCLPLPGFQLDGSPVPPHVATTQAAADAAESSLH